MQLDVHTAMCRLLKDNQHCFHLTIFARLLPQLIIIGK